ncbi:MAG: D-aminoacyl-tRNA deacylase [Halobacteriales archaeon]
MLGIVVSRADEASVHIGEQLREVADWTAREDGTRPDGDGGGTYYRTEGAELRTFDGLHIELEGAADPFGEVDLLAFASRHSGDTGPLLTAHHTGNVGPAEFGGAANRLAMAAPGALTSALESFEAHAPDGYDVGLECTHHGPSDLDVPSLFVEIGSEEPQWRDPDAAEAAAGTILALRGVDPLPQRAFVGFGGGHYAPRFTRVVRETNWAVGHVAADWGLEAMGDPDPALLQQAFDRSGAELGVVDGDRPELESAIEALGYRLVGESWLRETSAVALGLVERVEAELGPVDEGLRFGQPARDGAPTSFDIVEPPPDLLSDANGADADRVRQAADAHAVAYETVESGSRVAGRVAVVDRAAWRRLESALVDVLRERFDAVALEDDAIVATERAFEPERARKLGVEPGPAFGRLAAGEPVDVGDERIDPEAVHVTRTRRYPRV